MQCPNKCEVGLTQATNKDIEFEDSDGNTITEDITMMWCPKCKYIETIF